MRAVVAAGVALFACSDPTVIPDANPRAPDADLRADASPTAPDAATVCVVPAPTTGVSTVAGCDVAGLVDGGRAVAQFANPVNVTRGPDGSLYVADFDNDAIRMISTGGTVTTLTRQANFLKPFGLVFLPDGTLLAQTDDNPLGEHTDHTGTLWRINLPSGSAVPLVTDIGRPRGLLALPTGQVVLADYVHHTVRLFNPTTLAITPLAGAVDEPAFVDATGPQARFFGPYGMARLADGRIAVADYGNHRIRAVSLAGEVTTLAGSGGAGALDGPVTTATFFEPQDLAVTDDGAIIVADSRNHSLRIVRDGTVTTLAGAPGGGFADSDDLMAARFWGLEGLDVAGDQLYIADGTHGAMGPYHRVRMLTLPSP